MARWWWPGNDVTQEELKREINLFADHQFGGVEVQPLNIVIPMDARARPKVTSWDTPTYYENLKTVMEEARRRGLIVDMTNGSGWPPGGPFLPAEDGFLSLDHAAVTVHGGKKLSIPLPQVKNRTTVPSRLQAVVASKLSNQASADTGQLVRLDEATLKVVTRFVRQDTLHWDFPEGKWKVIAFWALPSGEQTGIAATPKQGPVVDHLDSTKVLNLYRHLFGSRTELQPYFGNPMRAIFNDSYEFKANRHYSPDFIAYFNKKRGYDITPYLPANMQRKYNFVGYLNPHAKPDFMFSNEDWRLRYDYDVTLGELLGEHFFNSSKKWMEPQGLLHRTQAYGLNMDMIAMAGLASIPETESMLGSEAAQKVMTSGALLYNKPVMTAESVVFGNRAYTTTPQKIKLAVDKLFATGVNQIIYHGIPYRYKPEKLGPEGWYPFSSPFIPGINFSSNLGEANIFWNDQKQINEYVSRVQYALRSGKSRADVLIYFPFLSIEELPANPEEIMGNGHLADVEGALPTGGELVNTTKVAWATKVYPLINELEAAGVSWAWVNDASIQEAKMQKDGKFTIRGNQFCALILANDSTVHLKTAEQINRLASEGMRLLVTDGRPTQQPSFLNWKENDRKTAQRIQTALNAKNSRFIDNTTELRTWISALPQLIKFKQPYTFTRQSQREMSDGSRIHFIWNKSADWHTLSVTLDKKYKGSFWLDATTGTVTKNRGSEASYQLPPYSSVLLFASGKIPANDSLVSPSTALVDPTQSVLSLTKWTIKVDSVFVQDTSLFDWKKDDRLRFSSTSGIYTSTFQWKQTDADNHFFLDLGKVCFTAEVYINNAFVGKQIVAPYLLDITKFLKSGDNKIEVRVTPGQLNNFIGKARNGDVRYRQFKGKEDQAMSAGLIGPVLIRPESTAKF
ncbi:glycosyl hydrolase [Spirosoma aerophilum]